MANTNGRSNRFFTRVSSTDASEEPTDRLDGSNKRSPLGFPLALHAAFRSCDDREGSIPWNADCACSKRHESFTDTPSNVDLDTVNRQSGVSNSYCSYEAAFSFQPFNPKKLRSPGSISNLADYWAQPIRLVVIELD